MKQARRLNRRVARRLSGFHKEAAARAPGKPLFLRRLNPAIPAGVTGLWRLQTSGGRLLDNTSNDAPPEEASAVGDCRPDEPLPGLNKDPAPELERSKRSRGPSVLACGGILLLSLSVIIVSKSVRVRTQSSHPSACPSQLTRIGIALEMYSTDNGGKYPTSLNQLTPNYLKGIPKCPASDSMTYRVYFGPNAPCNPDRYQDYYYLECHGENHKAVGVTGDYPAYNAIQGLLERSP